MNKITTIIGLSFAVFFLIGLATTKLLAIKIGCINSNDNGNISVLIFFKLIDINLYQKRLRISS